MGFYDLVSGFFNGQNQPYTKTTTNGSIEREMFKSLSYDDVKNIYNHNPLGKRIVTLPIKLALSGVKHNIPSQYDIKIEQYIPIVKEFCRNVRLYGIACMFPVCKDEDDDIELPLYTSKLYDKKIKFNVTDPINTNITINTDVCSYNYNGVESVMVRGKKVYNKRLLCLSNRESQLYLSFSTSAMNYSGQSVYMGIYPILNLLNSAIMGLERMILNSSVLILKNSEESINSNIANQMLNDKANMIQDIKLNSVITLKNGYDLNQMPLSNLDSITQTLNNINNLLALSACDIPPQIFLGDKLSNGLSEGSAELEQLSVYLDNIRNELINPALKFVLTYAIYNKVQNIDEAELLVNNLDITYNDVSDVKEIIDNTDELIDRGVMGANEIRDAINK